jgi:hypothetical protein
MTCASIVLSCLGILRELRFLDSRELITDSELENGAPSLEDRCQILRQKIGSLEADIFRSGIAPTSLNCISY